MLVQAFGVGFAGRIPWYQMDGSKGVDAAHFEIIPLYLIPLFFSLCFVCR